MENIPPRGFYLKDLKECKYSGLKAQGDFVEVEHDGTDYGAFKARMAAYAYGKYHGIKIITRARPDNKIAIYHGGSNGKK